MSEQSPKPRSTGPAEALTPRAVGMGAGLIGSLLLDLTALVLVAAQAREPSPVAWMVGLGVVVFGLILAAVLSRRFKWSGVVFGAVFGSVFSVGIAGLLIWFVHASGANAVFGGGK